MCYVLKLLGRFGECIQSTVLCCRHLFLFTVGYVETHWSERGKIPASVAFNIVYMYTLNALSLPCPCSHPDLLCCSSQVHVVTEGDEDMWTEALKLAGKS